MYVRLGMFFVLYQILCKLLDKALKKTKHLLFGLIYYLRTILLGRYWTTTAQKFDCPLPHLTMDTHDCLSKNNSQVEDTHIYQLPVSLSRYVTFYMNQSTEPKSPEDLARLQAKNIYFNKDDLRILIHKRCIMEYVYPHLDDQQFRMLSKRIEDKCNQIFALNCSTIGGMVIDASYPDPDSCIIGEDDDDNQGQITPNQSLDNDTLVDKFEKLSTSSAETTPTENGGRKGRGYVVRGFGRNPIVEGSAQRPIFGMKNESAGQLTRRNGSAIPKYAQPKPIHNNQAVATGYLRCEDSLAKNEASTNRRNYVYKPVADSSHVRLKVVQNDQNSNGHTTNPEVEKLMNKPATDVFSKKYDDLAKNEPEQKNYVHSRSAFRRYSGQRPPSAGSYSPKVQAGHATSSHEDSPKNGPASKDPLIKDEAPMTNERWFDWHDSIWQGTAMGQFQPMTIKSQNKVTTPPHATFLTNNGPNEDKEESGTNFSDVKKQRHFAKSYVNGRSSKQENYCNGQSYRKDADKSNYSYDAFVPDEDDSAENVKATIPVPTIAKDCTIEVPVGEIQPDVEFECEICFILSPSKFAIRPFPSIVDAIEDELTQMIETYGQSGKYNIEYNVGEYCTNLVKGKYRRCRVMKANVDELGNYFAKLLYLDSGESHWASTRHLHPLPVQSRYYQRQAIPCKLYGLAPNNPTIENYKFWGNPVVESFQKFCSTSSQMYAKSVCEKLTDDNSYTVSLYTIINDKKSWAHECLLKNCFRNLIVKDDLPAEHYSLTKQTK